MRYTTLVLAAAAAFAAGSFAAQADTFRLAQASQGAGQQGTAGSQQLGGPANQQKSNNPAGPATTGTGVGGAVGGNAQQPGGTNNEQTGTQSHDAQKGGSGKDGAR